MERAKRLLGVVFLLLLLAATVWLVRERWEWVVPAMNVAPLALCVVLALKAAMAVANAWKFDLVVRMFGLRLPAVEWIGLSAVTVFYGRLVPFRLGSAPRAVYLKKKYKFRYSKYVSLMAGAYLLEAILSCWVGVGASLWQLPFDGPEELALLGLFVATAAALMLGSLAGLCAARRRVKIGIHRIDKIIAQLQASIVYYRRGGSLVLKGLAANGAYLVLQTAALGACFWALGPVPDLSILFACTAAVALSAIPSLTPGNLGVSEGTIIATCAVFGVPPALSTPAALLSRATALSFQIASGLVFSYVLFGSIKPAAAKESQDGPDASG